MTTANTLKTVFLLTLLTALFIFIGRALGGTSGMVMALMLALLMNFISYWFSDRIALGMAGAKEVGPDEAPELHQIVEELATYARMPKPRVYVIPSDAPNAFATGRDPQHAAVAATTGIMHVLSRDELKGVIAHELAHIRNRDTLIATVVATMAGAITMVAYMAQWALMFGGLGRRDDEEGGGVVDLVGGLLLVIVAPIAATLIQLAISRAREFQADAIGARILGNPLPLASALERLEAGVRMAPAAVNPATSHLYIVNPLHGGMAGLFSTHPATEERVRRLREVASRPSSHDLSF